MWQEFLSIGTYWEGQMLLYINILTIVVSMSCILMIKAFKKLTEQLGLDIFIRSMIPQKLFFECSTVRKMANRRSNQYKKMYVRFGLMFSLFDQFRLAVKAPS